MKWRIDGAKTDTGEERTWNVEAPTRQIAEAIARQHGIAISAVRAVSPLDEAATALEQMAAAPAPSPPVPSDGDGERRGRVVVCVRGHDGADELNWLVYAGRDDAIREPTIGRPRRAAAAHDQRERKREARHESGIEFQTGSSDE